jgi:methylmalonyl-CoA mutase C-terminal domain/subunit
MPRKIRVLVGKPGLDGHDRGAKVVAAALRDAGMEVIYTGLHQTSEQVVEAALQEDVDVVALSILSGAHMTLVPEVLALMKERSIDDKLLTGGGIIPPEDMESLAAMGVGKLFGPGSSTVDIVDYIREWFAEQHGTDALTPLPARRESIPIPVPASGARAASPARRSSSARKTTPKSREATRSSGKRTTSRRRRATSSASSRTTAASGRSTRRR